MHVCMCVGICVCVCAFANAHICVSMKYVKVTINGRTPKKNCLQLTHAGVHIRSPTKNRTIMVNRSTCSFPQQNLTTMMNR